MRRAQPEHLAAKLLAIRQRMGASQTEMTAILDMNVSAARVCEYEQGKREPSLLVLLRYARIAGVHVDDLIDDKTDLAKLR